MQLNNPTSNSWDPEDETAQQQERNLHHTAEVMQQANEIDENEIRQVGIKSQSILFDFDGYFEKLEPEPDWL